VPDDEHLHLVEGLLEGPQDVLPGREVRPARGELLPEELAEGFDLIGDGLQRLGPARLDDFVQRTT